MGYVGYSKSERAVGAEFWGLYPASVCARMIGKGVTASFIRDEFEPLEWHHTSKFYNVTNYYSLEKIKTFLATPEGAERLKEFKANQKRYRDEKKAIQSSFERVDRKQHEANCVLARELIYKLFAQFKVLIVAPSIGFHGDLSRIESVVDLTSVEDCLHSLGLSDAETPPYLHEHVLRMERLARDLQDVNCGKSMFIQVFRWNCLFFVSEVPPHIRIWSEVYKD